MAPARHPRADAHAQIGQARLGQHRGARRHRRLHHQHRRDVRHDVSDQYAEPTGTVRPGRLHVSRAGGEQGGRAGDARQMQPVADGACADHHGRGCAERHGEQQGDEHGGDGDQRVDHGDRRRSERRRTGDHQPDQ